MVYQTAAERLGSRDSRKVMHNTYLQRRDDRTIALHYHTTDVMVWHADGYCELFTGGWRTSTTKLRLNEFLPAGFRIYQERGTWFLCAPRRDAVTDQTRYVFAEGMRISDDGIVSGAGIDESAKRAKLKKRIREYARNYVEALKNGNVPAPSGGDCWGCLLFEKQGDTSTDHYLFNPGTPATPDTSHYLSHLDEGYFVPSIAVQALTAFGGSQVEKMCLAAMWGTKLQQNGVIDTSDEGQALLKTKTEILEKMHGDRSFYSIGFDQLEKHIYRFVCRKLGFAG